MKKKLIAALYEQGFHESVVDSIWDDIYQLSGARYAQIPEMEYSMIKDHIEKLIEAFKETLEN